MSGRPAAIRQRDAKQIIKAAKQAGAKRVEVKLPGDAAVIIHLDRAEDKPEVEAGDWIDTAE